MRQTVRLGRVAGIAIGAHWSALVIAVLLGYGLTVAILPVGAPGYTVPTYVLVAAVVSALFLACLLAHELAHALVARRQGVGVRRITLWLLGGVSELDGDAPSPRAEFLIAGAGPLVSLVIGGVAGAGVLVAAAVGVSPLVVVALSWLAAVNVLLGLFNLLPGAPLDGGRIIRALMWRLRGDRDRAQISANRAGVVLGVLLAALGLTQAVLGGNIAGLWLVLLGWFLVTAANAETASIRLRRALDGRRVRDIMATEPVCGHAGESIHAFITDTAARHPHSRYPVLDGDGRPVGQVRLADLARVPPSERPRLPLGAAAAPTSTVAVDEPASAAARTLSPTNPLVAVTDNGQVVGVVAPSDVAHAVALAQFGHPNGNEDGS